MPIEVWNFHDPAMPPEIMRESYRGGDENWVVVSPHNDWLFELVCKGVDISNEFKDSWVREIEYKGVKHYLYCACHA